MSLLLLWLLGSAPTASAGIQLQRLEILADDPGTFLHWELVMLGARPGITAVRFLEQVQPVWRTPWPQLMLGTSLSSQSLTWEQPFTAGSSWGWRGGIQTQTLLPRGLILAGWWRGQHLELAGGLSLLSGASWSQPDWRHWQPILTLGLSLVRPDTPG